MTARPLGRGDLVTSLVFIFPLLIAYQIGVLFTESINGADFVTSALYAAVGRDRTLYLLVWFAVAVGFVAAIALVRRRRELALDEATPVMLESAIYALTIGTLIIFVMQRLFGLAIDGDLRPACDSVVTALGAGVYEELVFRLGLFAGGAALLFRLGVRASIALLAAAAASSVLFSLAHHLGSFGDAFETHAFVYRLIAGLLFAAIFYYRSLAHAVYTHVLYDVYVMVVQ